MESTNVVIEREAQTLESLLCAIDPLINDAYTAAKLAEIAKRELFTPTEDEELAYWFARFVTLRSNLWMVVDTAILNTGGMGQLVKPSDWQYFVLGYSAVCALIRLDRFLLTKVAKDSIIQRKLNEEFPAHRIARKQYSEIYSQLTLPSNAIRIHQAHRLLRKHSKRIGMAVINSPVETIYSDLYKQERYIDLSKRQYLLAWLANRRHSLKRRGASAKQKSVFTVLKYSGRVASNLTLPRIKKVTPEILAELNNILKPGDILVTRHHRALTNLFLPGFWPHTALYVGSEVERQDLEIRADSCHVKHWNGDNRTFEALKDGVRFRTLEETLSVDALVVIRPNLTQHNIADAISRVVVHAGKSYNFDFDFFRSDRLVCTEVIYRAYDGINQTAIPLQERLGRKTLSAEDLLDLALDTSWATPVAVFGVGESKNRLVFGDDVFQVVHNSYRETKA